uniref:GDSL esterase/lipase n=1 Tax=Leersia perrieri TaxID=77586 RepID=A0A0D9XB67_9ORYZ
MTSQQLGYCCIVTLILNALMSCSAGKVPAIIVFGDSTVDAGNNNFILTIAKGNFPPYGRDFDGGVATGRFSNGRLVTDFVSEALGLPSSVPAYLDSSYTIDQFATGVSFASGGTGLDDLTARVASVIPLSQQLEYFKDYIEKLKVAKGEDEANEIITEAIYIFSIGTNDFIINYFNIPLRPAKYTTEEYIAYLVSEADAAVRAIYDLGARKVLFAGLAPIGCLPSSRTLNHDAPGECNEEHTQVAVAFNAALTEAISKLNDDLAGARVAYSDTFTVLSSILSNPSDYGFVNIAQGCCGTGMIETSVLCGLNEHLTCQDDDSYVFFDSVHPSERTYKIVANKIIDTDLNAAKVPAIIVFGDSTVDAGNNNGIPTAFKANFPPYGRDFDGGVATGRFSNGRLVTDLLSEELGLPSSVPAYLDPSYTIHHFATGVSFASAGTGLDPLTAQIASVIPLSQQLEYFKEYKEKLKLAMGEEVAKEIIREALYIFSIGTNDFIINYFLLPLRPAAYTTLEYIAYLIGLTDVAVRDAYKLGARKILFAGLTPLGCLPSARTLNLKSPGECNEEHNHVALMFNAGLTKAMSKLNNDFAGARVVYSDIYGVVSSILSNPSHYGFVNVAQGCCGTGLIEASVLCGLNQLLTCQDDDAYAFFDSVHPSERTYKAYIFGAPTRHLN